MKKILAFLLVTIALYSCTKDAKINQPTLVGKYKYGTSVEVRGDTRTERTFPANDYIEFKADGTGAYNNSGTMKTFKYTLSGKNVTLVFDSNAATFNYTISLSYQDFAWYTTFKDGSDTVLINERFDRIN